MPFTAWDNTCPYRECRKPIEAEFTGLERDGLTLTCPRCQRPVRLAVYDSMKHALLLVPSQFPDPVYWEVSEIPVPPPIPPTGPPPWEGWVMPRDNPPPAPR
jgi:hypothetical protein